MSEESHQKAHPDQQKRGYSSGWWFFATPLKNMKSQLGLLFPHFPTIWKNQEFGIVLPTYSHYMYMEKSKMATKPPTSHGTTNPRANTCSITAVCRTIRIAISWFLAIHELSGKKQHGKLKIGISQWFVSICIHRKYFSDLLRKPQHRAPPWHWGNAGPTANILLILCWCHVIQFGGQNAEKMSVSWNEGTPKSS